MFGQEDATHFYVGAPLELEHTQINLDLRRLVERSVGVFGKSGTGKSFLTRVLLAGFISRGRGCQPDFRHAQRLRLADHRRERLQRQGPQAVVRQQSDHPDAGCRIVAAAQCQATTSRSSIGYDEIEPSDLEQLRVTMNFSDAMIDAIHTLSKRWGKGWIRRLLKGDPEDIDDIEANTTIASGTLIAVQRRMERFERWDFLSAEIPPDNVAQIIDILVEQQKSVVLEFGRYGNSLEAYMLVANYLTRRIHEAY